MQELPWDHIINIQILLYSLHCLFHCLVGRNKEVDIAIKEWKPETLVFFSYKMSAYCWKSKGDGFLSSLAMLLWKVKDSCMKQNLEVVKDKLTPCYQWGFIQAMLVNMNHYRDYSTSHELNSWWGIINLMN